MFGRDEDLREVPDWVRELTPDERIRKGFYDGVDRVSCPHGEWKPLGITAIAAGFILFLAGSIGWAGASGMIGGIALVVGGLIVWAISRQEDRTYERVPMSDQEIVRELESDAANVARAEIIRLSLATMVASLNMPADFTVSAFEPTWGHQRPGQKGMVAWNATVESVGIKREASTGPYGVGGPGLETAEVAERVTQVAFRKVREAIDEIRDERKILPS